MLAHLPLDLVSTPHLALLGIDIEGILASAGPWAIALVSLIVFVESGVLFPFLPGDSLLFTLGVLSAQGSAGLNFWVMLIVFSVMAILGSQVGYFLGAKFGRGLFKPNARILNTKNLAAAEDFFTRHGGKALILARFVPVIRTFVPLAAGVAQYRYRDFTKWNITGAIAWVVLLLTAGVLLGNIPFIKNNVDAIVIVIVVISLVPVVIEVLRERAKNKRAIK